MSINLVAACIRGTIKQARESQKDVAQRLGISEAYLSDICTGRRGVSAFVAVRLERVLGINAQRLLSDQIMQELEQARMEMQP